ncbi:MAG: hypothetical protein ACP5D8_07505 [Fidelibacterota bacterium]
MTMRILKILMLLISIFPLTIFAGPRLLSSYPALMKALNGGERVRVILHYGECDLYIDGEKAESSPGAVGGMDMETFEWFPAGLFGDHPAFVVASKSVLIANPIGDGYVINYVKIRVEENGSVTVTARYLNPQNHEVLMDETFKTQIFSKQNEGAAYFYADE